MIADDSDAEQHSIGCIDLFDLDVRSRRAAIGMYIAPEERGKGYGRKALLQLVKYAFGFLGLAQLYIVVGIDNQACIRLFRSLNFEQSGVPRHWIRKADGQWTDAIILQKLVDRL